MVVVGYEGDDAWFQGAGEGSGAGLAETRVIACVGDVHQKHRGFLISIRGLRAACGLVGFCSMRNVYCQGSTFCLWT